jgi:hypothetical protein
MSELGQSRHFDRAPLNSGLPQQADIFRVERHVLNVPISESDFHVRRVETAASRAATPGVRRFHRGVF